MWVMRRILHHHTLKADPPNKFTIKNLDLPLLKHEINLLSHFKMQFFADFFFILVKVFLAILQGLYRILRFIPVEKGQSMDFNVCGISRMWNRTTNRRFNADGAYYRLKEEQKDVCHLVSNSRFWNTNEKIIQIFEKLKSGLSLRTKNLRAE
jgi:hypothetical protein